MSQTATVGGGCFWCIEAVMQSIESVESVVSGYAGGSVEDPSYRQVCGGRTGHAEVVQVTYDESEITYKEVLEVFFAVHNPETKDRQGPDVGSQYRSIILYNSEEQERVAEEVIERFESDGVYDNIVTEVSPLEHFYVAEDKHQDFYEKNPNYPYCQAHIPSKLKKLEEKFPEISNAIQ